MLSYLLYRLQWHLAPYLPYGKLIHLDLELNNNCNQSCISCWHGKPKELSFKIEHMNINTAYGYLVEARKLGAVSVKFNLRGEPLLYKYSLELLIKRAKDLGYVETMINTNGIFLTRGRIMSLSDAGLDHCILSVDSFNKETYDKIHGTKGKKDYSILMQNLADIARINDIKKIKTKIGLNFHKNKYNKDEKFKTSYKYAVRFTEDREGKYISLQLDRKRKRICSHMKRRLTVLVNGKIYPCCMAYNEPEDIDLANDLPTALERRKQLIDRYRKYNKKIYPKSLLPDSCINCKSGDVWK